MCVGNESLCRKPPSGLPNLDYPENYFTNHRLFSTRVEQAEFCMSPDIQKRPSTAVAVVFDLLNPIPFGFFVGALIFDAVYVINADVMWFKSAAWLISIGLFFSVVPRLINLFRVWFP